MRIEENREPTPDDLRWFWLVLAELADDGIINRLEQLRIITDADRQIKLGKGTV